MLRVRAGHRGLRRRHQHLDADRVPGVVASLGIGGEWAAGAAMVAEVVPERPGASRRARCSTRRRRWGCSWRRSSTDGLPATCSRCCPRRRGGLVFLCGLIPAGVAFIVRMFIPASRSAGRPPPRRPPRTRACASCSRRRYRRVTLSGFADRGVDRADHLVELQCVHPDRGHRARGRRGRVRGLDPAATAGARRAWKSELTAGVQPRRPDRHAVDDPARQALRPPHDVRRISSRRRPSRVRRLSASISRRRRGCTSISSSVSRFRRVRQLHVLPARAVPDPPARTAAASATTSAACSRPGARLSWVRSAAGKGDPGIFLRAHLMIAAVPLIALLFMSWVVETRWQRMPD